MTGNQLLQNFYQETSQLAWPVVTHEFLAALLEDLVKHLRFSIRKGAFPEKVNTELNNLVICGTIEEDASRSEQAFTP